jgi:hypothetical protein
VACRRVEDPLDLSHQANFVKCVDQSMEAAMPQVQELAKTNRPNGPVAKN